VSTGFTVEKQVERGDGGEWFVHNQSGGDTVKAERYAGMANFTVGGGKSTSRSRGRE